MQQGLKLLRERVTQKKHDMSEESQAFWRNLLRSVGFNTAEDAPAIEKLAKLLNDQHQEAMKGFQEVQAHLTKHNLTSAHHDRHQAALEAYQAHFQTLQQQIKAVLEAPDFDLQEDAIETLDSNLRQHRLDKSHQKINPDQMPWGSFDPKKVRQPATSDDELSQQTGLPLFEQTSAYAANTITPDMLNQPGGPTTEDLAQTPEISFSQAIQDKAEALNYDPLTIYN